MDYHTLMLDSRLHNEDTPEKRRQAAAAAARRGRAANAGNASDAQERTGARLLRRPSGEACLSRSTSFKRATDAAASANLPPLGSSTAGYAATVGVPSGSTSGADAASPGGPKPAKPAALAGAKGKGSDAAR